MAQEPDVLDPRHRAILDDPDFQEVVRKKNNISAILTIVTLLLYFAFMILMGFKTEVLATRVAPSITLGVPFGIGIIVISWILTGIYVRWANGPYDAMVARVKQKLHE